MYYSVRFSLTHLAACLGILLGSRSLSAQAVFDPPERDTGDTVTSRGAPAGSAEASDTSSDTLPLCRLTLFASGVGFFEHRGTLTGSAEISLPFKVSEVNDALKSLMIGDPASSPQVVYPSEQTLSRTLQSLSIDLSAHPSMAEILDSLKGAEIEVYTPGPIRGRILGVEYRSGEALSGRGMDKLPVLSLVTGQGIRLLGLQEISRFVFQDPRINADLNRALDMIMDSRNVDTRNLRIQLPGEGSRVIALSYVIPAPVWKVSYRLDLSATPPVIQGWAIVDNDSDADWNNLELSLVSGRPVSFIQNLYAPYYLSRPVLPLAIAGIAEARTYDSGWSSGGAAAVAEQEVVPAPTASGRGSLLRMEKAQAQDTDQGSESLYSGNALETAQGSMRGDQFEFTLQKPVNLARQQSAMLPLVEASVQAVKTLVFSGAKAAQGGPLHPAISAELTNTTGMRLPAGPITVYDGEAYGGDALLEFFPEQEKRLISYGDDLSVSGYVSPRTSRLITAVTVRQGIMTITRKLCYEKTYTFKNTAPTAKRLVLEHPITSGATLKEPASFDTRTDTLYRFVQTLPAAGEVRSTVTEEKPLVEQVTLTQLSLPSFISYAGNEAIPEQVRAALQQAIDLKQKVDAAKQALTNLSTQWERLVAEQDRTRRNLEAAGNQTPQGAEYLKRLVAQDQAIDDQYVQVEAAEKQVQAAQEAYDAYLGSLQL
ncbi:MAG: hypothetical protein LBQ30_08105 [Treponema sp.]|nr:hypothetical protein [Treponema sp.]